MPAALCLEKPQPERTVSKLSRALSKLNLRSPGGTLHPEAHTFRLEQTKLLQTTHSNAKNIISRASIPSGLTKERVRDYIHSIPITPKGHAFLPQHSEIVPKFLYISDKFTGTCEASLKGLGITHVVAILGKREDIYKSPDIKYQIIIEPAPGRSSVAMIDTAIDFMDAALQEGGSVLVFCRMGTDWSASMAIAWLMRNKRCTYDHARSLVGRRRQVIAPGRESEKAVKEWQGLEYARLFFPLGRGGRRNPNESVDSPPSSPANSVCPPPAYDDDDLHIIDIK